MQEFIKLAQEKLGLSAGGSESSTAAIIGLLKNKMPTGDFKSLADKVPGLADLAGKSGSGGGMLGGLASSASSLLGGGGGGGSTVDLFAKLASSGLSVDKAGSFVSLFGDFIKKKAGAGMLDKILASVPDLKKLLGS